MRTAEEALSRLCDAASGVSAHYLISERGRIWQLVDEEARAWHAGQGAWGGLTDLNSRSIGIELANDGGQPFGELQMIALETLLAGILARWQVAPERVIGHSDMALGRKVDPGPRFDWRRLARRGLSVWPEAGTSGDFEADARRAGYRWNEGQEDDLLAAFRMRFRPHAHCPRDDTDGGLVADLAARWPAAET
ncbi:N-acetylmuramoyl-L-alanine amidase [Roseivivax halodurans JCM 10272]|uniref:N-acetylmuramoyl-L-alanine amidase n=1 Tax=Roseivivax halodurans JCM 10272 TaxID=1449350 RepID=X7EFD8_9RHOB|nr:N-acetylmuramoyl-L-alanine amidase [Roseivivax halodurans]ETX13896.1 N-acetylmuramoyl-L-alanine amidase [Roseivivax halodurans JCM 10272]